MKLTKKFPLLFLFSCTAQEPVAKSKTPQQSQNPQNTENPQGGSTLTKDLLGSQDSINDKSLMLEQERLNVLQVDATQSQKEVNTVHQEVEWQRDRQGKITRELLINASAGCKAKGKIESMQIKVVGSHLEPRMARKDSDSPFRHPTQAQSRSFTFTFGNQLNYTHADEEAQALFTPAGQVVINNFVNREIGEIEYLRIEKMGIGVENVKRSKTSGWLFKKTNTYYENNEIHRYAMNGIEIYINNQLFYQASGTNHLFQEPRDGGNLFWEDRNLAVNPAYLNYIKDNQCSP